MKKENGITLIALIITIIIMLILVSVSISILINSGLIEKAKYAGQETKTAYDRDSRVGDSLNINGVIYNGIDEYIATINGEDGDLAKLQEFFGRGFYVLGFINSLNDDIEPIPDASTSIEYVTTIDTSENVYEDIFIYNNKIYGIMRTYNEVFTYGEVTRKQYSNQFITIAMQGEETSNPFNINEILCYDYENQRYALNFENGAVNRYCIPESDVGKIYLYNYYYEKVSISSEYNPRLWIDNEEREVELEQDGNGYMYIQLSAVDNGKQYRITLTIDGETVEGIGHVTVIG